MCVPLLSTLFRAYGTTMEMKQQSRHSTADKLPLQVFTYVACCFSLARVRVYQSKENGQEEEDMEE